MSSAPPPDPTSAPDLLDPAQLDRLLPGRPWTDPEATSLGRLPARPLLVPCPDLETARGVDLADPTTWTASPWWRSLDGTWELEHRGVDGRRTSGPVEVPGAWTLQGRDAPHYTNVVMPFDLDPPAVPSADSVGVYHRRVVVPRGWRRRRVVLRIGAAESFHAVLVDGELVGYGTDSRLPSEYDLTDRVRAGRGFDLAIVVFRWSAQSWVEDQDQWWHGGLQRSVALLSPGEDHLADVGLVPGLAPEELRRGPVPADRPVTGTLQVDLRVAGPAVRAEGWTAEVHVETWSGRRLATTGRLGLLRWDSGDEGSALVSGTWVQPGSVTAELRVPGVLAWSSESPSTYRAVVTLRGPDGSVAEVVARRTGFRSVEVADRELRINGAPVEIHGVNLHEHHPRTGRAVPVSTTRQDLELVREHNLNAVRAAHYPHDEHLAELCDELGVYLVDEADVESHARQVSLCRDPRFGRTMVERVERMARRDRNHPSVVVWSLGNESGDGPPQAEAAAFLRRFDPSRPVQYEGPLMHDLDAVADVTDVVCPMYTGIDELVARAGSPADTRRPVILCEYSHAMGNSNGSLSDYWDAIDATPGFQGGFIWEWLEHGIPLVAADGTPRVGPDGSPCWGYGGDFGDRPHDGNFICDGLVSADRVPHPAMAEVHHVGRPVRVEVLDARRGRLRVHNRRWFTDTSDLVGRWELTLDGRRLDGGEVEVGPVPPRGSRSANLRFRLPAGATGEAFVTTTWSTRRRRPWASAGHVVSREQFAVPVDEPARARPPAARSVAGPLELEFAPTLFRALTDNDAIQTSWMSTWSAHLGAWSALEGVWPDDARADVRLRRTDDGRWDLDARFELLDPDADVPRLGVVALLPPSFRTLEWFGDGPHETYPDRRASATVGRWRSTVAEQYVPYAFPQDHGFHTDVRWLRLGDPDAGVALEVLVDTPGAGCSVRHHTDAELFAARHVDDLTPLDRPEVTELHLGWTRGLGTGSCGPDALTRYRIGAGRRRLRARFRLVALRAR